MVHLTKVVFWFALLAMVYVYMGYPLLLATLSLMFRRKRPAPGCVPFLSILIAAYNEEAGIRRKLEETLALEYPPEKIEIIVLSDGSTDRTNEIVRSFADPRVQLLQVAGRKGKTNAQVPVQHSRGPPFESQPLPAGLH